MSEQRVLLVCHNHPDLLVGGVEMYVKGLYEALRRSDEFEPVLLARAGRPFTSSDAYHPETPFTLVNDDPNQYLIYTKYSDFDYFYGRLRTTREVLTRSLHEFLLAQRPAVVHIQHSAYLGYDMVRVIRNALPDVPIVYTLQEYMPICHRHGQMVRTREEELCQEESPRRCHECFPEISTRMFHMRKRFIQSHLSLVDRFVAPSRFLLERYVDWGVPRERICHEDYGFLPVDAPPPDERHTRNRFAYFGQLNPYKGVDVLLKAMELLGPDFGGSLEVHGANYEHQSEQFREEVDRLFEATRSTVTHVGPYEHGELGRLMAEIDWVVVPSIWWENSPLVISEAFLHGRPVICSDIGGMAEKVANGVSGLQFARRDPQHLAKVIQRAADTPGLWERLRSGIPPVRMMDDHVAILGGMYRELLDERASKEDRGRPLEKVRGA